MTPASKMQSIKCHVTLLKVNKGVFRERHRFYEDDIHGGNSARSVQESQ